MVIPRLAPLHIRIELIVGGSALVLIFHPLLHVFFALSVLLDSAGGALLRVGVDKDGETVRPGPQNVLRSAADDHAGFLVRQFRYDLALIFPELILLRFPDRSVGKKSGKPSADRIFSAFLDIIGF